MKRILLIDDEEDICVFSKALLERTGRYTVTTATSASAGLELAKRQLPDLIMLDVNMPDMDGGDVAQALEACEETKKIPVLFVTALLKKTEMDNGKIGRHNFIAKPVDPAALIERIDSLLMQGEG